MEAVMGIQTADSPGRLALVPEPAGSAQAHAGVHPDARGPHGLAPEPWRPQGEGAQAAHQGPLELYIKEAKLLLQPPASTYV